MEVVPGRPPDNAARMLEHIRQAHRDHVQLLVFPELAVSGYLVGDEWERSAFLRECEDLGRDIAAASGSLTTVFGNVALDPALRNEDGRLRKYNALFVSDHGTLKGPEAGPYNFVIKTLLPNYRQFDDNRHFYDLRRVAAEHGLPLEALVTPVRAGGLSLGCLLCEDAWDTDYGVSPLSLLASHRPDLYLSISASPFTLNKDDKRKRLFSEHARRLAAPLLYVNNVGIQNNGKTVYTFDGESCVYDNQGRFTPCGAPFAPSVHTMDLPLRPSAFQAVRAARQQDTVAELYRALSYGTQRFMQLCNIDKVTIGISGGIDSSVVAALYARLLDPSDLLLVTMPGPFTSDRTLGLASSLARNLGCLSTEIPIRESVELTRRQLDGLDVISADGTRRHTLRLTERLMENVQARDRSSRILSAVAAAFGGGFTCNANKSEATVGYSTLYGDLAGFLASIGDLWKTEVYELARHLNERVYEREVIPSGSIGIRPSAELSPAHDVNKGLGDPLHYAYHDRLFASWVEWWNRATPEEALTWYAEGSLEKHLGVEGDIHRLFPDAASFVADLERWWELYQGMAVAKRIQAPPVLGVKRRAFGYDHRESQMGARYTRRYLRLKRWLLHDGEG